MTDRKLQPLAAFSLAARRGVCAVLTDIDDTLTMHGRLTASAYAAMERLDKAGIAVVPVTGRPGGWCDLIARHWPVKGVVGENGAFYFSYDAEARRVVRAARRPARPDLARNASRRRHLRSAIPGM